MNAPEIITLPFRVFYRTGLPGLINLANACLDYKREPLRMSSYPIFAQIEPTVFCNLQCSMCANPITDRKRRHMTLKEFKQIIETMPYLIKISLVGAGEPLLNPELFEIIRFAKAKHIRIGFATNAMLLDEATGRKIIESGVDWLNISMDSADQKTYERIRKGAHFETLTENIRTFMRVKHKAKNPEVSVWSVIMPDTIDGLSEVIKLSRALGVNVVCAQLEHSWGNPRILDTIKKTKNREFAQRISKALQKAQKTAADEGVRFTCVNVPDQSEHRGCKWPWKSYYITAEGFITPCCLQGSDPAVIHFGNILTHDFKNIWNNSLYQDFRKSLKSARVPLICQGCTSYCKNITL